MIELKIRWLSSLSWLSKALWGDEIYIRNRYISGPVIFLIKETDRTSRDQQVSGNELRIDLAEEVRQRHD